MPSPREARVGTWATGQGAGPLYERPAGREGPEGGGRLCLVGRSARRGWLRGWQWALPSL